MSGGVNRNSISAATRRDVFDLLRLENVDWAGRFEEADFLSRLYDLDELPSHDSRFRTMGQDIWQHRVNNPMDWDDDWVFSDSRLNLLRCPDSDFLSFLCEMLHPVVRPDIEEAKRLASALNQTLRSDGWELVEKGRMANRPLFAARRLMPGDSVALGSARKVTNALSAEYVMQQVNRMEEATESDPELAIGTAKEFVETICKTILDALGESFSRNASLLDLVKQVRAELQLLPENISDKAKGANTVKRILSNLGTAAQGIAELRGLYGTGHGKTADSGGIQPRHARLAVGAATTLGVFLFETYQERAKKAVGK